VRKTGLVQLKTGDAITGAISRRLFVFRYLRIDNATALAAADDHPTRMDGYVLVPKINVAFIQQATLTAK